MNRSPARRDRWVRVRVREGREWLRQPDSGVDVALAPGHASAFYRKTRIGRDIALAAVIGLIAGTINHVATYPDRGGYFEQTGYPAAMLRLQAVATGVGVALFAFLAVAFRGRSSKTTVAGMSARLRICTASRRARGWRLHSRLAARSEFRVHAEDGKTLSARCGPAFGGQRRVGLRTARRCSHLM